MLSLNALKGLRAVALAVAALGPALGPLPARADAPEGQLGPAPAPHALDAELERHATRGQQLLDRGQFQDAIASFRRAYELRADARFLRDIGECYRHLEHGDQALYFYRRYLSVAPEAPDRDAVAAHVAVLERGRPATPLPVAEAPAPALTLANDVRVIPVDEPAPPRALWQRWWAWTALGAVLAGGVVLAFTLSRADTEVPPTALGDQKFF